MKGVEDLSNSSISGSVTVTESIVSESIISQSIFSMMNQSPNKRKKPSIILISNDKISGMSESFVSDKEQEEVPLSKRNSSLKSGNTEKSEVEEFLAPD